MRLSALLACACLMAVSACSNDDRDNESTDSDDTSDSDTVGDGDPDVDMNEGDLDGDGDGGSGDMQPDEDPPVLLEPPARGFQALSPEITMGPGGPTATCYYFRSTNTEPMAINRFASAMTVGDIYVELYRTSDDLLPPGTVSMDDCTHEIGATEPPQWLYSVRESDGELVFPSDANGNPLALEVAPNTPMYLRFELSQNTTTAVTTQIAVNAHALAAGSGYKPTAPYVMYNGAISIPNQATAHVESSSCGHSDTALFWLVTMHAHKQATTMRVANGGTLMYSASDWKTQRSRVSNPIDSWAT